MCCAIEQSRSWKAESLVPESAGVHSLIEQTDVITYLRMCSEEGVALRRGMNFKLRGGHTVVLMSQREGAPYADRVEEDGRVLIYEGHDIGRGGPDPKSVLQRRVFSRS